MIQIHKHDKGELYSIYGFFIDSNKDVWVNKKQLITYNMQDRKKRRRACYCISMAS